VAYEGRFSVQKICSDRGQSLKKTKRKKEKKEKKNNCRRQQGDLKRDVQLKAVVTVSGFSFRLILNSVGVTFVYVVQVHNVQLYNG
jgi:hypothetical protein